MSRKCNVFFTCYWKTINQYDFEELSDKGMEECEKNNYTALCVEAFEELTQ